MYEFARKWATENQGKHNEIVKRFQDVMNQTKGTKYSLMAQDDMEKAVAARDAAVDDLMKRLELETSNHVMNNEFSEAAKVYDAYTGPLAGVSKEKRKASADKLRKLQREFEGTRQSQEKETEQLAARTFDAAIAMMATGSVSDAKAMVADAMNNPKLEGKTERFKGMANLLDAAEELDRRVLNSFRPQQGKTIQVDMQYGGTKNLLITDVSDKKVMATRKPEHPGCHDKPVVRSERSFPAGAPSKTRIGRHSRRGVRERRDSAEFEGVSPREEVFWNDRSGAGWKTRRLCRGS